MRQGRRKEDDGYVMYYLVVGMIYRTVSVSLSVSLGGSRQGKMPISSRFILSLLLLLLLYGLI